MKRTTGILVCTLAAGMAWAQSPNILENTRTKLNTVQKDNTAASNEALGISQPAAKDSHAKPAATAVKSTAAVVKTSAAPVKVSAAKANGASTKTSASTSKASVVSVKASVVPVKANVAPAKANVAPAKISVAGASTAPKSTAPATPKTSKKVVSATPAAKVAVKKVAAKKEVKPAVSQKKTEAPKNSATTAASYTGNSAATAGEASEAKAGDDDVKDAQDKKWSMSGKRDPFISPVVNHAGGSGCSTGKKCLEIGAINLRGVVHSDGGFIAVVTNSLNKAYFLRENDPVFDGYVVKITGDSVVFKETMQDRLGKTFTREVVKKITTPAV
jgi:hypothetical protein